jgi:hypothetical protein
MFGSYIKGGVIQIEDTQLEEAGSAAGALCAVPAPLLRVAHSLERSLSTGSNRRSSGIGPYLDSQLRNS